MMKTGSSNRIFKCKSSASASVASNKQLDDEAASFKCKENVLLQSSAARKFNLKKVALSDEDEDEDEMTLGFERKAPAGAKLSAPECPKSASGGLMRACSHETVSKPASMSSGFSSFESIRSSSDSSSKSLASDIDKSGVSKAPKRKLTGGSQRDNQVASISKSKSSQFEYDFELSCHAEVTVFNKAAGANETLTKHASFLDGDETIVADSRGLANLISNNFYSKKSKPNGDLQKLADLSNIADSYRKCESIKSTASSASTSSSSSSLFYSAASSSSSASTSPVDNKKLSEDFERQIEVSAEAKSVKKFTLKTSSSAAEPPPPKVGPAKIPRLPKLPKTASSASVDAAAPKPFYNFDTTAMETNVLETASNSNGTVIMLFNSRKAYECEELGETQAFADDLFYLMDGLSCKFSTGQRCLSAIKFAEHCLSSDFRMHLRSSHGTLAKVFSLLGDCTKEPSLALCTACIMYALSRDKLAMEIDKSVLKLMIDILKTPPVSVSDEHASEFQSPASAESLSAESARRIKPTIFASRAAAKSKAMARNESGEPPEELYSKSLKQCKQFCEKLLASQAASQSSPKSASKQAKPAAVRSSDSLSDESSLCVSQFDLNLAELSAQQLALECLLHLTANKKAATWLKDELVSLGALELIVDTIGKTISRLKTHNSALQSKKTGLKKAPSKATRLAEPSTPESRLQSDDEDLYLICKYSRCINFLENLTQSNQFSCTRALIKSGMEEQQEQEPAAGDVTMFRPQTVAYRIHSHLVEQSMVELCQESLELFYAELLFASEPGRGGKATKSPSTPKANVDAQKCAFKRQIISHAIKKIFLFYLNLTQADVTCTKKLLGDERVVDLVFVFIREVAQHVQDSERFDITVLGLIILINLLVVDYNLRRVPGFDWSPVDKQRPVYMLKDVEWEKTKTNTFQVIWDLFISKQARLETAENEQNNEIMELNEILSTQNAVNINLAITESIHKAGKNMEEHILAAHSAIIVAYMLKNVVESGEPAASPKSPKRPLIPETTRLKAELPSGSFECLVQVIEKYLGFMDIMKLSGLSAAEHLTDLLGFLAKL